MFHRNEHRLGSSEILIFFLYLSQCTYRRRIDIRKINYNVEHTFNFQNVSCGLVFANLMHTKYIEYN